MSIGEPFVKQRHRNIGFTTNEIFVKIVGYVALTLIIIVMLLGIYLQSWINEDRNKMAQKYGGFSIIGHPEEKKVCIDFRYDVTGRKMNETSEHSEIRSESLGNFRIISVQKNSVKEICSKNRVVSFTDLGREFGVSVASLIIHILHVNY